MKQDVQSALKAIECFDFSPIRMKLSMPEPEGKGWDEQTLNVVEKWYKRFLMLHVKYPNQPHVPNEPIDAFWHTHILDTRKYIKDCELAFGEILHHFPYFGLNGDSIERDEAFDQTNKFYRIEFGEDCTTIFQDASLVSVGMGCNHSGSGTGCGQR